MVIFKWNIIEGTSIDNFKPNNWSKSWEDIFTETISLFEYLEINNILHRDIRPAIIMIDRNENIKIFDFGFGKTLSNEDSESKSVFLNWPVSQFPKEIIDKGIYNHQTEIYFIGKFFHYIIGQELNSFKFKHIIDKMIKLNPNERYISFNEVSKTISQGVIGEIDFSIVGRDVYINFANILSNYIIKFTDYHTIISDAEIVLNNLATIIRASSLEYYIQNNQLLINCFVDGKYIYSSYRDIEVSTVTKFYNLLRSLSPHKQK